MDRKTQNDKDLVSFVSFNWVCGGFLLGETNWVGYGSLKFIIEHTCRRRACKSLLHKGPKYQMAAYS